MLLSLILSRLQSPMWLLFTAFVGLNLFQSAFTGRCLMEKILRRWVWPKVGDDSQPGVGAARGRSARLVRTIVGVLAARVIRCVEDFADLWNVFPNESLDSVLQSDM